MDILADMQAHYDKLAAQAAKAKGTAKTFSDKQEKYPDTNGPKPSAESKKVKELMDRFANLEAALRTAATSYARAVGAKSPDKALITKLEQAIAGLEAELNDIRNQLALI
jgi:hypothetical protein